MVKKLEVRDPQANFDLEYPDNPVNIYIDGVSQLQLGFPVSKLICHSVTSPASEPGKTEQRQVVATIAIPTLELMNFIQNAALQTLSPDGRSRLTAAATTVHHNLIAVLQNVDVKVAGSTERRE